MALLTEGQRSNREARGTHTLKTSSPTFEHTPQIPLFNKTIENSISNLVSFALCVPGAIRAMAHSV
jgi:hypothetical protein